MQRYALSAVTFIAASASAQVPPPPPASVDKDFVVVAAYLDQTMAPKNLTQTMQECIGNTVCKGILDGAMASVGVPSSKFTTAAAKIAPPRQEGEEGYFRYSLPSGYEYCRSKIETVSIVPATGERGSVMGANADGDGVTVYTWTPKQNLGGGRSWVEARYTIIGVALHKAAEYRSNGKCTATAKHPILNCRGARPPGNSGDGRPPCGTVNDI